MNTKFGSIVDDVLLFDDGLGFGLVFDVVGFNVVGLDPVELDVVGLDVGCGVGEFVVVTPILLQEDDESSH
jgi:hypothetical protein